MPLPNIGPGELILILIIALVVLGPGKLPDVAQSLGKSVREFRKAASDITDAGKIDAPPPSEQATAPAAPLTPPAIDSQAPLAAPEPPAMAALPPVATPASEQPVATTATSDSDSAATAGSTRDPNLS
jgi:TatA/E family protein of Tat protein translocase